MDDKKELKIKIYLFSGFAAGLAAILQGLAGYYGSSSLLSDAMHAVSDSMADIAGAIALILGSAFLQKYAIRFVSFSLLLAAGWVIWESYERITTGFLVLPYLIIFMGAFGIFIDLLRLFFLSKVREKKDFLTESLFLHAKSDFYRSVGVFIFGLSSLWFREYNFILTFVDGVIAILLSVYMFYLSFLTFKWGKKVCEHKH